MFKKLLKNNFGLGIVDAVIGAAILAVAIKGFMDISGVLSDKEAQYNKKGLVGFSTSSSRTLNVTVGNVAGDIRDSIINSDNTSNRNVFDQGLCPYVEVPSLANGPGIVNVSVFKESEASALADDWRNQDNHVHVEPVDHDDCDEDDNYNFCLAYDIHDPVQSNIEQEMKDMDYLLLVKVVPQELVSTAGGVKVIDIDTTADFKTNIKNVIYKIILEAKTTVKGVRNSDTVTSTAWAGDLGVCTIGGKRVLPLADGYGDKNGNAIYNIVSYDGASTQGQDLAGVFENLHIQEGVVIPSVDVGVVLQSKLTGLPTENLPTAVNCAEKRFQCRSTDPNLRDYGPSLIAFSMYLNQLPGINLVPVEGNPVLSVTNGVTNVAASSSFSYTLNGQSYEQSGSNVVHSVSGNQLTFSGADKLDIAITDTPGGNSANNMCRSVCIGTEYNDSTIASPFAGNLSIKPPGGGPDHLNLTDPKVVSCTACYMKNCSRFGLATFGSMKDMPNEPLDSGLPECAIKTPVTYATMMPAMPLNPDSCLKANWVGSDLNYVAESCATDLPVLCYNFGKYLLAQDLLPGPSKALALRNFTNASQRCYEMGSEVIDSVELGHLLGQQGTNMLMTAPYNTLVSSMYGAPPVSVFQINNLAKQGIFLSPQISIEKSDSKIWFDENSIVSSNYFWTNLKTDSVGNVYAPIPFMYIPTTPTINDTIAAYYSEAAVDKGNFLMKSMAGNLLSQSSGGGDRGILLFNNLRYRGALSVSQNSPFGGNTFRFLCREKSSPFSYFVSLTTGANQAGGEAACNSESGYFVPPITPHDWVNAMLLTKSNDPSYPFPDPAIDITDITALDPVWIAYEGSGPMANDWKAFQFTELSQIISVDGVGFEKVNRNGVTIGTAKKGIVCQSSNSINGFTYRAGPGVTMCPFGQKRIRTADLIGTNNLINRMIWLFSRSNLPATDALEI